MFPSAPFAPIYTKKFPVSGPLLEIQLYALKFNPIIRMPVDTFCFDLSLRIIFPECIMKFLRNERVARWYSSASTPGSVSALLSLIFGGGNFKIWKRDSLTLLSFVGSLFVRCINMINNVTRFVGIINRPLFKTYHVKNEPV